MLEGVVPWSVESVEARRLEFCRLVVPGSGVSFSELCRRFGVSRKTGYKWLNLYRVGGSGALVDRSRVPVSSPLKTSSVMEDEVCDLREEHPAWGGRKINRRVLDLGHVGVPAASTITGILRRRGLMAIAEPQAGGFKSFQADACNDLWQMDFKGWLTTGTGRCDPFDVIDDHSRFYLVLRSDVVQQRHSVMAALSDVFCTFGMPRRILCDNGPPWGNTQPGFRWTRLSVWLLDLGVRVSHSRPRHPQTLGKDERFHRTMDLEVIGTRPVWDSHQQLQTAFDRWRRVYNHERPHDSLNGDVPATRYQPSARSMPPRIAPVVYPDGYQVRVVRKTAEISFQGHLVKVGKAFRGRRVAMVATTQDGTYTVNYRHQPIRSIDMTE
jgi:transposase InsO family protein